jgi:light-regulated signal transduction histidine kinase (bacteriophytochrome)
MSISIIRHGKLWGLIACHNYSPRILPRHLRAICELFGSMFSLQLEARENGEQFQERLASRMVLQNLMLNLASAEDYAYGLTQQSPNLLDYIHGGDSTLDGARNGGVAVAVKGQLTFLGVTPNQAQIEAIVDWLNTKVTPDDSVFSTDRLGEVWPEAKAFADVASGILAISVSHEPSDYIIWFRPELVGTTQWAGEPKKLVASGPDGERLSPRKSFEIWKETVRGRCLPWAAADLDAAFDLRVSLLHVVLRRINAAARERKRAADRDKLLLAELDHRVKNTIANIQALVVQTSRSADTLTGFVEGLDGRIQSMAKAHSLLSQSRWEGVSINRLLHEELNPYVNGHSVIHLTGTDVLLTPKSALSLSLAIHELATNAAKYGALRRPSGRIAVLWRRTEDSGIALSWHETGGPTVSRPAKLGFGTALIERALAMETGGTANIQYLAAGVVCDIYLPGSSVAQADLDGGAMAAEPPGAALRKADAATETFRILVVEDSFLIVLSLEAMLDDLGWTIIGPAAQKAEAISLAGSEAIDAALLDVNLNGEMTWDVAAVLKERGIPFVFSTGYDIANVLPPFLAGSQVVSKPFGDGELEQQLRLAIAKNRAEHGTAA